MERVSSHRSQKGYKRVFVDVADMDRYIEENKTVEPVQA